MIFSMLYAKNAGRKNKTLYLSLLEFSGFGELFGDTEYDIGDVILEMREENPMNSMKRQARHLGSNPASVICCIILGKLLKLAEPLCSHLENGKNIVYTGLLRW